MIKKLSVVMVMLATVGIVWAGNLPTIIVQTHIGGARTAAASTNAPSLVTTNIAYQERASLLIQNTNTAGTVTVYFGTNTAAPQAVLGPGQNYTVNFPVTDNGSFSCRSAAGGMDIFVAEAWGQ